jgi:hypothetical protein
LTSVSGEISKGKIPTRFSRWNSSYDPYITDINATNTGSEWDGKSGDVFIGYFKPVPGINDTPDIDMSPVHHEDAHYFMIVNALAFRNTNNSLSNPGGTADKTRQSIKLDIDFGVYAVDQLMRVNSQTGEVENVPLQQVSGQKYTVSLSYDGGKGDLFFWKNAHSKILSSISSLQTGEYDLNIYPNPAESVQNLMVRVSSPVNGTATFSLFDMVGMEISTAESSAISSGISTIPFMFSNIPVGSYLLRMDMNDKMLSKKLIISE